MANRAPVVLRVCSSCASGTVEACRGLVDRAGLGGRISVRGQDCLNCCGEPVAIALQGDARVTYVFDGVDLSTDQADIVATAQAYLDAPGGLIADARPCGRLRHRLRARVLPPETGAGDD